MNLDEIIEALSNYVGTLSHDEDGIVFSNRNTLSHMKNVPLDGTEETASKYELRKVDTKVRCFLKIEPSIYRKDWLCFDIEEDTLEIIGGHSFNFDPKGGARGLSRDLLEGQLTRWGFEKKHGCEQLSLF